MNSTPDITKLEREVEYYRHSWTKAQEACETLSTLCAETKERFIQAQFDLAKAIKDRDSQLVAEKEFDKLFFYKTPVVLNNKNNIQTPKEIAEFKSSDSALILVNKIIFGCSGVVQWSKSSLYQIFSEILVTYPDELDAAIASWLNCHLSMPIPEKTPAAVWAAHLDELFGALVGLTANGKMRKVLKLIRERKQHFRRWLAPLFFHEDAKRHPFDNPMASLDTLIWMAEKETEGQPKQPTPPQEHWWHK